MFFSRSLLASALVLSFSTYAEARVAQHRIDPASGDVSKGKKFHGWTLRNILGKRQEPQVLDCSTPNLYIDILEDTNGDNVQTFCNKWLDLPPMTTTTDYTPILTTTTSNNATSTITSTIRTITTETVVKTTTPAAVRPRAANIAAKAATANQIISSVIDSGTVSSTLPAPENTERAEAESGLSNACSCKNVDPTSTDTVTFTAPTLHMTAARFFVTYSTSTSTKIYTETTTMMESVSETTSPSVSTSGPSTESLGSSSVVSGRAEPSANSTSASASSTAAVSVTLVSSGVVAPTASPSGSGVPTVIGLPFECPGANEATPHFIVGDLRYEYSILCDTAIVTSNEITTLQNVTNATACAVECSIANNVAQKEICQAAMFITVPGSSGGSCLISGATTNYVKSAGSTTIILTGVSSKADNCASADFTNGARNATIDTSALVASVTSAGFSLSTPGFVTKSEAGGVERSYFSSRSTDSLGYIHWSWFEVYASSSAWWAVYATSWSCTWNVPQTIVIPQPAVTGAANITSVISDITTIINSGVTTVISGTSTRSFTNGGGVLSPTAVPASTTSGGGAFTTGFSTATSTGTAGGGVEGPSVTSISSGAMSSQIGVNGTSGTGIQGSAALTVSGGTATFNSTGDSGVVTPSPTNGSLVIPVSSATATSNSTGLVGSEGPSLTSGVATFVTSSSTATSNSTGGSGGYGSQTSSAEISLPANSTILPAAGTSAGSLGLTVSEATTTSNSTGSGGIISPTPSSNQTTLPTGPYASGGVSLTFSGNTSAIFSTGGAGSESGVSVTSGGFTGTLGGETHTANSTGGQGEIPTSPTSNMLLSTGTGAPSPSSNETIAGSSTQGSLNATVSGGTAVTSATGGSDVIPPTLTANSSMITGSGSYSTSDVTSSFSSYGSSGVVPPPSINISETTSASMAPTPILNSSLPAGTGVFSTSEGTTMTSATGSQGIIPPLSSNMSATVPASSTPSLSSKASVSTVSGVFSTSGGTAVSSSTGGGGIIPPSASPTLSTNATSTPMGTGPSSSGALNVTVSGGTAISLSTESGGIITPSANSTATLPPSLTPSPSLNASSTSGDISDMPRTGGLSSTTGSNSTMSGTAPIGTGSSSSMPANSTALPGTALSSSSFTESSGYGPQPTPTPSTNMTSMSGTGQPSITMPPMSANSSSAFPTANSTDLGTYSYDTGDRFGSLKSRSSGIPTTNITASSFMPTASSNSSVSVPLTTAITTPINSTQLPVETGSSGLPPVSANSTSPVDTASGGLPTPSANASIPLSTGATVSLSISSATANSTETPGTGFSAVPTPSGNMTVPLSTGVTASASLPTGYPNSTLPAATGSLSFSNSEDNRTGIFSTSASLGSTAIAPVTANSTSLFPTGGTGSIASTSLPTPSLNTTLPPPVSRNTSSVPSASPTPSLNTSAEACPTSLQFSTVPRTIVITTVSYETIPVGPSTCLPTTPIFPFPANATTIPTATGASAPSIPLATYSTTALAAIPPSASAALSQYRRANETATPEQIAAACANTANLVFNAGFDLGTDSNPFGWTVVPDDAFISLRTFPSPNQNGSENNAARVLSAAAGRYITISQPLTLCPGKQYALASRSRQDNLLADCTVKYAIGDDVVYTASPQEGWLRRSEFFTAGMTAKEVSKDLVVRATCAGEGGLPAGTDEAGYMVVELDDVSVVQDV